MRIIGNYASNLQSFFFQQLTQLAQKATASGEYAGGTLLDADVLASLKAQANDFSSVPFLLAGQRATEESFQRALDTLGAKYSALASERNDFILQMNRFVAALRQDNQMVEALIRQTGFERWKKALPQVLGSSQFGWDFGVSQGIMPLDMVSDDVDLINRKETGEDVARQGISVPHSTTLVQPQSLAWQYQTDGQKEELFGTDWARLSILEDAPRAIFGSPEVSVIMPVDGATTEDWGEFFTLTGSNNEANIPVYIRNYFLPRRTHTDFTLSTDPITLSSYRVSIDDIVVYDQFQSYFQGFDYNLADSGQVQPLGRLQGKVVTIGFTEYFPAYQCSVDGKTWSDPVMLDYDRPEDMVLPGRTGFGMSVGKVFFLKREFPVTDEVGNPTGLFFSVQQTITKEFTVQVQNSRPAGDGSAFGLPASLELEFDRPVFLNGIHLDPFVNFPAFVRGIYCESILGSNPGYVFQGNYLLDHAQDLMFPKREVLKMRIDFYQINYSIKNHLVDVENRKKLEGMLAIQSALPYQVRNLNYPLTKEYSGVQYEFGFREISGVVSDPATEILLGKQPILINGPFHRLGIPDVYRIDADVLGPVAISIITREHAADGSTSPDVETSVWPGYSYVYSPIGTPDSVDFFVKFQLADATAVAQRFFLQVK